MLVLLSDLHLNDESTSANVNPKAFDLLGREIQARIENRGDINELRIVLLGDILDLVRTDFWERNHIELKDRPWGGTLNPRTNMNADGDSIGEQFGTILSDILGRPASVSLCRMAGDLFVANRARKSSFRTDVTYVFGNHDRMLYSFPEMRTRIAREFGDVPVTFETMFESSEYGVRARHGNIWDDSCHSWEFVRQRKGGPDPGVNCRSDSLFGIMNIGEVITAELMAGFVYRLRQAAELQNYMSTLMELDNVRPMTDVFQWIRWFEGSGLQDTEKKAMYDALKGALGNVLDSAVARGWQYEGAITHILGAARKGLDVVGFDFLATLASLAAAIERSALELSGSRAGSDVEGARNEFADPHLDGDIQFVVYGHTHRAENLCFQTTTDGGRKMYINTGTYLPLVEMNDDRKSFLTTDQMTMAFFYSKDENTKNGVPNAGPTLELWNGLKDKVTA